LKIQKVHFNFVAEKLKTRPFYRKKTNQQLKKHMVPNVFEVSR